MGRNDKLEAESARLRKLEDAINQQLSHIRGKLEGLQRAEAVLVEALQQSEMTDA